MGCCCGKQSDHQQLPRGESKKGGRGGEGEGGGRSYSQLDNVQYHDEGVHLPLKNEYEPQPADLTGQQEQGAPQPEPIRMQSLPDIAPQVEREFEPSGKFYYLPESYSKPQITPASENAAFDLAAGEVKQIFDTQVVAPRRRIDSCLKDFKKSLNEGPDVPLTSCFDSWKNKVFEREWDVPAGEGEFLIKFDGSDEEVVKAISANKEEEELTPEVNAVQSHMNTLLEACHELLNNAVRAQQQIREKNLQLSLTVNRNMRTEAILRELRGLPTEVDQFTKEVLDLLNDIKGAVVLYGRKKITTGVLMLLH